MSKSIMQTGRYCYMCGFQNVPLERHHVMNGNPNRAKAERFGLWVYLCPECHRKVHAHFSYREHLKADGQRKAMKAYNWTIDDFRRKFGKNYL